jgi:GGDEF domain-containing protein
VIQIISTRIQKISLPILLFALVIYFYPTLDIIPTSLQLVLRWLPYAIYILVAILAAVYHKYQVSNTAIIAIVLYTAYLQFINHFEVENQKLLLLYLSSIFPIVLLMFYRFIDKPLWHPFSLIGIALTALLIEAPYINFFHQILNSFWPSIPHWFSEYSIENSILPNLSLIIYALIIPSVFISYLLRPSYYIGVLAVAIPASMVLWFNDPLMSSVGAVPLFGTVMFVATAIALISALTIESYDMAYRDELTQMPARRALMSKFNSVGKNYIVAMLDVDHFKKFNDTYGHDIGDEVLKMVAQKISSVKGGKAYRYGGEEFTIVFNNKTIDQAILALEKVRTSIGDYPFVFRDNNQRPDSDKKGERIRETKGREQSVRVTISIGVAQPNFAIKDPMAVLKMADEALYRAKESGRNCLKS